MQWNLKVGIQAKREHFLGLPFEVAKNSVEIIETHRISVEIIETQGLYGEMEYGMKVLCFLLLGLLQAFPYLWGILWFLLALFTLSCGPKDISNASLSGSLTSSTVSLSLTVLCQDRSKERLVFWVKNFFMEQTFAHSAR